MPQPSAIQPNATPEQARDVIHAILGNFVDTMAAPKSAAWSLFIMREQLEPTEAFERIYNGVMGKMLATLVEMVRAATGRRDTQTAEVAVVTLIGQVIALRASRATVLRLLRTTDLGAPEIDAVKRRIAANTDAILDRLIAERQDS